MSTENEHPDDEREENGDAGEASDTDSDPGTAEDEGSDETETAAAGDDDDAETEDEGDEAPAAAASATPARSAAASAASAGARLAAAKAAKAAKKAAKKQSIREASGVAQQTEAERAKAAEPRDAQEILTQSPLGRAATRAGEWAESNRQMAIGVVAVAAIAVFGWLGFNWWNGSQATAAGLLLEAAIDISDAEIVAADAEEEAPTPAEPTAEAPAPTFETAAARSEAALAAYRRVSAEYPSSTAAIWAKLGEGRSLSDQGHYDEARTAYEAAFHASGDETVVAWQALEGIGASYEAEENWDQATATYERLTGVAEGAYASVASYHLARMHAASGDEAAALTAFRELVESLQDDTEDGEPPFPYILAQAELRLRELDPSAGGAGPRPPGVPGGDEGGGLEGLEGMDPEQLQELIRQLQTKSGGGAH